MSNDKYGKSITDEQYVKRIIQDMQYNINNHYKGINEYSEDGMKEIVLNKLDDLGIYPDDIDYIFSELEF